MRGNATARLLFPPSFYIHAVSIVVMCEDRISGELMPEEATQERIMELATERETAEAA
jgi:ribose transport system ATP-binding protein